MDILPTEIHKDQDLKLWLEQLREPEETNLTKGTNQQSLDIRRNADSEFDSILCELNDLEKQFEFENKSETKETAIKKFPSTKSLELNSNYGSEPPKVSKALEEFSLINSQLEDVLNDLAGFVDSPSIERLTFLPSKNTSTSRPPPPPVPVKNRSSVPPTFNLVKFQSVNDRKNENWSQENYDRKRTSISRVEKSSTEVVEEVDGPINVVKETEPVQACVSVHVLDGSVKCVFVTNKTTVEQLCDTLIHEHYVTSQAKFSLWEILPDLFIERQLQGNMLVLGDVVDRWSKNSNNKLTAKVLKSQVFPTNLKSDLEGSLHIKIEEKKAWKSYMFVMKPDGMFYFPKGKGKCEAICYRKLDPNLGLEVYIAMGWKKKFKAPTEYGFAIKHVKAPLELSNEIKYFCADSETLQTIWITSIKKMLHETLPAKTAQESLEVENISELHYPDDTNHYAEPFQTASYVPSRRFSDATSPRSCLDYEDGCSTPSLRKAAVLPITTETTRLLNSLQSSTLSKPLSKSLTHDSFQLKLQKQPSVNERQPNKQICYNEYSPTPVMCKSPEVPSKPSSHGNLIKTLPKPNRQLSQNFQPFLNVNDDLPPPPASLLSQNSEPQSFLQQAKSRTLPPPPPKRDNSTKLSSKPNENPTTTTTTTSIQTRNFILNLDRTIGLKKTFGADGFHRVEMPLPPPPVVSGDFSYIDLGELPPPPAELLQGLKKMRANPMLFQPYQRWHQN